MLTDKMKEVQLVQESKLLKISPQQRTFSRYDKTVFIIEPIPSTLNISGEKDAYIEAGKFFALFPELTSIEVCNDYCHLTLKNGAEYKLPFYPVAWQDQAEDLPDTPTATIKLAAGRLSSATLKNLANPMLQCIYIDEATAVSCNSMVACIDGTVTSETPLLLPPDIISIIEGSESNIYIIGDNYVITIGDGKVFVPIPKLDYKESADILRGALPLPEEVKKYPVSTLLDSLKRLSASHDVITFTEDRILADEDYEPFNFPTANSDYSYNIQSLLSVAGQTTSIAQSDYALLFYGDQFLFMVSPETNEEAEEVEETEEE